MKKNMLTFTILIVSLFNSYGQILHPVKWSYASKRINKNAAIIFIKATINGNWHIYSLDQRDGGPVKTSIEFFLSPSFTLEGNVSEPQPVSIYDKTFAMDVHFFEKSVVFRQKIRLTAKTAVVKGQIGFMACNNKKCLPEDEVNFKIPIN